MALAATIGFALLIVPGIIVGLMFSQFINIMIDRQVGVIDALRLSMQVTEGNKLTLFLLGLLMAAINSIGTSLTCGLFTIAFVPFSWLVGERRLPGNDRPEHRLQGPRRARANAPSQCVKGRSAPPVADFFAGYLGAAEAAWYSGALGMG